MNSTYSTTVTATDEQRPSMAVIDLVAEATGVDALDLDPLYHAIDPEALDSLCTDSSGFSSLEFDYSGRTVVVEQVGDDIEISLEPVTVGSERTVGVADSEPSI